MASSLYPSEPPPIGARDDEPEIVEPRRRPPDEVEMDITPMIDIVFLLLIFFVVASRLDPSAFVDVPAARHGATIPEKSCVILIVAQHPSDPLKSRIYKGANMTEANRVNKDPDMPLEDLELEIQNYVEEAILGGKTRVLIRAEGNVQYQHVEAVRRAAAGGTEGESIHVGIVDQD